MQVNIRYAEHTFYVFCAIVDLRVCGQARSHKLHTYVVYQWSYNVLKIMPIWSTQLGVMYRAVLCQFCCMVWLNVLWSGINVLWLPDMLVRYALWHLYRH
jgi:hypothetical protein